MNFFDSANQYHKGQSDETYGRALAGGLRQKVQLMTKCDIYSRDGAMKVLEEQLEGMKTDYLDLWACHQVSEMTEVDQILAPGGSLEAFVEAKKQGKVRHIGFTGHRNPEIHLRLLTATDVVGDRADADQSDRPALPEFPRTTSCPLPAARGWAYWR